MAQDRIETFARSQLLVEIGLGRPVEVVQRGVDVVVTRSRCDVSRAVLLGDDPLWARLIRHREAPVAFVVAAFFVVAACSEGAAFLLAAFAVVAFLAVAGAAALFVVAFFVATFFVVAFFDVAFFDVAFFAGAVFAWTGVAAFFAVRALLAGTDALVTAGSLTGPGATAFFETAFFETALFANAFFGGVFTAEGTGSGAGVRLVSSRGAGPETTAPPTTESVELDTRRLPGRTPSMVDISETPGTARTAGMASTSSRSSSTSDDSLAIPARARSSSSSGINDALATAFSTSLRTRAMRFDRLAVAAAISSSARSCAWVDRVPPERVDGRVSRDIAASVALARVTSTNPDASCRYPRIDSNGMTAS
ncbi:hypothetical protein [Lapillicoccus sp.]|uniref:hypothetical protein n=1 Tax=Lapillicoccus sp. TaxID=1909287 RepID=UPI0032673843